MEPQQTVCGLAPTIGIIYLPMVVLALLSLLIFKKRKIKWIYFSIALLWPIILFTIFQMAEELDPGTDEISLFIWDYLIIFYLVPPIVLILLIHFFIILYEKNLKKTK
jgi:hypothetical protein